MSRNLKLFVAAFTLGTLASLPACQTLSGKVPSSAFRVASGSGSVSYRAAETGHLYVYERNSNNLRYSGGIRAGQLVIVDAANDRIIVDGNPVVEQIPLDAAAQFEIYLDARGGDFRTVYDR